MNVIARIVDGKDTTTEAYVVLVVLTVIVALVLSGWTVIHHKQPFNVQDFGVGMGALFAGMGAASWGRGKELKDSRADSNV